MNGLISVIVPIYNADAYLEKCINSILSQTYGNLDIILVDDGSTDTSGKICDSYKQKDLRIRVVHQDNMGLQASRKIGVELSKGEYIGFVDSDDWIENDMYQRLIEDAHDCDMVTSGVIRDNSFGEIVEKISDLVPEGAYTANDKEILNSLFKMRVVGSSCQYAMINAVWCKLFRADILKSLIDKINIGVSDAEDFLMTRLFALNCNSIRITHNAYYHYCVHQNTMVSRPNYSFLKGWTDIYNCILNEIATSEVRALLTVQLQEFFMYQIFKISESKFGIKKEFRFPQYIFPDEDMIRGKKIVLYGAGNVGISYYKNWVIRKLCNVCLWIDENIDQNKEAILSRVLKPETIGKLSDYDYVVCATLSRNIADQMIRNLEKHCIPKEKIIFRPPINYVDECYWHDYENEDCGIDRGILK